MFTVDIKQQCNSNNKRPAFVLIPRFIVFYIYVCVCMLQFIKNKICLNQMAVYGHHEFRRILILAFYLQVGCPSIFCLDSGVTRLGGNTTVVILVSGHLDVAFVSPARAPAVIEHIPLVTTLSDMHIPMGLTVRRMLFRHHKILGWNRMK